MVIRRLPLQKLLHRGVRECATLFPGFSYFSRHGSDTNKIWEIQTLWMSELMVRYTLFCFPSLSLSLSLSLFLSLSLSLSLRHSQTNAQASLPIKCPAYDTKLSNWEVSVQGFWGMWSTSSLLLLPGPLRLWVLITVRAPYMGLIELFNHLRMYKEMTDVELNCSCYVAIIEAI